MMFKVKRKPLLGAVVVLTSIGVTTSCIDNSYDLDKDIDMTINVGGEYLAFPIGSTEKITMDKIIEINDGDDLQVVNGEYHLLKYDDIDKTTTTVKLVDVDKSTNSISSISVINENEFPTSADYTAENVKSSGFIDTEATGIDPAVIEIGSLTATGDVNLTIKFNLDGTLIYDKATIKTMEIEFPQFLQFKEQLTDNKYIISNKKIDKNNGLEVVLHVTGFTFGAKYGEGKKVDAATNTFSLHEAVNVKTTVEVTGIDLSHKASLSITPRVILDKMTVNSMHGTVKPDMNVEPTEVELSNLPDFLQDDDVKLDITNPIFSFKANNPLNTNIELDGIMTGYKDGKITKSVKIGSGNGGNPIILKPSGQDKQTISLTRIETTLDGATNVVVPNLNDIIETIPDRISVKLDPAVKSDDYYTVGLGQDYILDSEYDIDVPLSFGSGLQIVYKDSIDDLNSDLEDIDFKKAVIAITADNIIPLQLEIKDNNVIPKDLNGKKIDDIKVTVAGTIIESKDGKTVATSQLTITLEETKDGAIGNLEKLVFKVTAVPGQATNVQLRCDQWMQLKDMKLKVPNGIKIDLN
nr:hypothetical protein [uncultured Bacteroides sp.]